jgi:hypothetical protein
VGAHGARMKLLLLLLLLLVGVVGAWACVAL